MIRMSETTRTHTPGKQLDCDILISSLMKHVLTNRPMFHSDSEKLRRKIWATKSSSSDQTWHIEKPKKFDVVCDMMFMCRQLDFGIHVIGSTPLLLLHYLTEKKGDSTHRGTCHWGWGAATHPLPRPSKFWVTQIFGVTRNLGKPNFYKSFHVSFLLFFLWKNFLFWA